MSSCFLCDCSCELTRDEDSHKVLVEENEAYKFIRQLPIMVGSSGLGLDDQQHDDNGFQNYISYKVKKIEFCYSIYQREQGQLVLDIPDYILIFKVPLRNPIIDYDFYYLSRFILYSEPECVLGYKIRSIEGLYNRNNLSRRIDKIVINKPFILGPNEYVGVLYMFSPYIFSGPLLVDASAKVWFDTA